MWRFKEMQERTLRIDNLPSWVDEEYLCICLFHMDSVPYHYFQLGNRVNIVKDEQTGHSKGYGFITFDTVDDAEKIFYTYNRLKLMPGTKDRFCLNWTFPRYKEEEPKHKKIRTINSSNNHRSVPVQSKNNNMHVKKYSDIKSSGRNYIHHDFIENIFLWLPAKSILGLRGESKAWSIMTRTIHFCNQHLKNRKSQTDPVVAIDHSKGVPMYYFLSNYRTEQVCSFRVLYFLFPLGFITAMSCLLSNSCNGLVCTYHRTFVNVVNPTIRETIQLPAKFSIFETERSQRSHTVSVGIGYDDSSETYKIIRIYGYKLPNKKTSTKYEVFTLGSANGSCNWRQLEEITQYRADGKPPVFLNGVIYWVLLGDPILIHSFDVKTEAMRILPAPEVKSFPYLIELGGCLCLIDKKSTEADLYLLEDYANGKWIKKHTIENFPDNEEFVATRDGNLLLHTEYYDMKDRMFKKTISQSNYAKRLKHCLSFRGCAESLVSPISYLQKGNTPCAVFSVFGQRWATQFPMNTFANCTNFEKRFLLGKKKYLQLTSAVEK